MRRIVSLSCALGCAAAATVALAPVAGALGPATPLTSATSARPASTAVVGRSVSAIVYNDLSNRVVYLGNPSIAAKPTVLARSATALAVSGNLVELVRHGQRRWRLLDGSGRSGAVPSTWTYLAPDGGLRIVRSGSTRALQYLHLDGSTQSYPLPARLNRDGLRFSVVADADGVVVAASSPGSAPRVAYRTLSGTAPFRMLRTSGVPHHGLTCSSLSGGAVGCTDANSVVRLSTTAGEAPQVTRLDSAPLGVAVTDSYTSWTAALAGGRHCPCTLASSDTTGTAASIVSGVTSGSITAGAGRFYFSTGARPGDAGVYVNLFAGANGHRVAAAARRPLHAGAPALGTGQAVWTDDSRPSWAVWTARIRSNGTRAGRRAQANGAALGTTAVSGSRVVFRDRRGVLHMRRHGHTTALGKGSVVALSGTRLLTRRRGHFVLRDLVTGARTDLTARRGAVAAALWGRYASYVRPNGSVWRLDLARAKARPRRLARTAGASVRAAAVYSWGDSTAWSLRTTRGKGWSSACRTSPHAPSAQPLPGKRVFGASAGGVIVGSAHRAHFELLSWRTGRTRAVLPGAGRAPAVDANTVAWLRHGRPTIAPLGTHLRNRPRALDLPIASRRMRAGRTWRLELPTSAPLTSCSVTMRGHGAPRQLACRRADQRRGDVLVRWPTGSVPRGHYAWTVSAAGSGGTLLGTAGGKHTFRGSITVR